MSVAVAYAPNRYSRVQMNMASLNYAPTKGCACSSLKGVSLHCIIFRTATEVSYGGGHYGSRRAAYLRRTCRSARGKAAGLSRARHARTGASGFWRR